MAEEKFIRALYDQLNPTLELGDYTQFENQLSSDDVFRKAIFDQASGELDLGDYATFESQVKKKVNPLLDIGQGTGLVSPEPSKESLTPQQPSPSTKKDRDTTVTGDLLRTFASTSKRMVGGMAGVPMLLNKTLATYTIRPILKAMGASDEEAQQATESIIRSNTMGQLASISEEAQTVLNKSALKNEQKMKQIEGSIWENLVKGKDGEKDVGAGFEQLGRMMVGFLPYSALTAATAGAGTLPVLTTIGATAAAQQYSENKGVAEPKRILNAWMYGGFEGVGEAVSAVIFRGIGKAFRQGLAKELPKNVALSFAKGAAESVGLESSSEVITQIGQNFTDIVTGVDPQRGLFDGVLDVALGSAAFGLISGGGGRIAASVLGRTLASDKESEQVQSNLNQQGTLVDQIESTDSDPVKSALESRLKTLRYEADKVMDKNFELAKELTPEQRMKVAELYSTWNDLQAKIDNGEVTTQAGVDAIEATINGVKEEIQSIKEATLERLGEIKKEGAKFKIGDTTFETEEAVEAWLDKNYQKRGLPPIWHTPTEKVIDAWYKRNKEEIDKRELQPLFKTEEETKDATEIGKTITGTGEQAQGVVEGEESSLRVRDTAQDRVEAVKGEEVTPVQEKQSIYQSLIDKGFTDNETLGGIDKNGINIGFRQGAVLSDRRGEVYVVDSKDKNNVVLQEIKVIDESQRGKGNATMVLKEFLDEADKRGSTVWIEPTPIKKYVNEKALSKESLINWYEKNGFIQVSDNVWKRNPAKVIEEPVQKTEEFTPLEHKANIEQQFREEFGKKGVPQEQIDGALALLNARANSWASEQEGRTPEQYYKDIAGVKGGEFAKATTPKLYQLPDGRQVMGMAMPEVTNGFYSPIEKRLLDFKQEKASVNKWKEIIGKGDEATFTGVLDWLNSLKPDQSLTKAEINQFMKDNRIEVVEVTKYSGGEGISEEFNAELADNGLFVEEYPDFSYITYTDRNGRNHAIKDKETLNESIPDLTKNQIELANRFINDQKRFVSTVKFNRPDLILPGEKENYKEVLVTLPSKRINDTYSAREVNGNWEVFNDRTNELLFSPGKRTQQDAEKVAKRETEMRQKYPAFEKSKFQSSHFDEPNILVHLRMNTRVDADGKKVLFLEEIQSDWGQKGREEGFKQPEKEITKLPENWQTDQNPNGEWVVIDKNDTRKDENGYYMHTITGARVGHNNEQEVIDQAIKYYNKKFVGQHPLAPFVTDTNAWVKLGLKTALKEAIKQGVDRIAWTTGEQQNERYDLSKQVRRISVAPNKDGTYEIDAIRVGDEDGRWTKIASDVPANKVEEYVGKDIAQKVSQGEVDFEGENLKVGGKGMIGFYGSPQESKLGIVGNIAKSLFKQEPKTAKMATKDVNIDEKYIRENGVAIDYNKARDFNFSGDDLLYAQKEGGALHRIHSFFELGLAKDEKLIRVSPESTVAQHSIDITPALKQEVEKGLPLFQKEKGKPKGAVETLDDGKVIIHALSNPDFSTMIHEIVHVFEKDLSGDEVATLEKWSGKKQGTREFSEAFARAGERYVRDGKAPNEQLKAIFEKFKQWLTDIYKTLKGSPIEKKLSPEVRQIFDRLLTEKQPTVTPTSDVTQGVTGESGITTPPEQMPPTVIPPVEPPIQEGEKRTLGIRALNSTKLGEDIKEGIQKEGINYIPRGRKVRAEEAQEIVSLFSKEEGGLDKVSEMVYNTKNEIPNDTRTYLNVYLAAEYDVLKNKSTDQVERDRLRQKVIDLYMFGLEQGTQGGQWVEAQKEWGKVFGNSPEMASALIRNRIDRKNKAYFEDKETELKEAKQLLDDVFGSPEGKVRIEQEVSEEINKIGTKNFGKDSKKKIDDFFSGLLIDPKRQNLYGGLLGIPVAAWNGSVLAVKNAVLLGVDIATAIQRGVEYLDKWYREEHAKGRIASPDWNKGEYESHMKEKLGGLKKEVPIKEKAPKKKEPKVKTPPTQEEMVNKLLGKMAGFATRKQLQSFMKDYMQEFQERGMIDDKRFRELLAKALGLDYVSDETQAKLTKSAQTLGYAQKKIREVIDAFDKLEAVEPNTREFDELRAQLKKLQKEAEKASFEAQKANQYIKTLLTDEPELLDKIGTLIQGNLLVPTSIIRNIYGNVFMLPARATRYLVMNTMDAMLSQVGIVRSILGSKVDPAKHPDIYRWIKKLPTIERTVNMFGSLRGYREGIWAGLKEGARQVVTGQLEDDYKKKEVQRGLEPIKAILRLRDSLTGKEKRSFDKLIGDILEAMPAGYVGEGMFRLLNLGDKPFRRSAERARLSEIAKIKGLKGIQREKFLNNPDNASLTEAQKAGDIAVYTNDNVVSKLVEYANKTFRKGEKSNIDAIKSTSTIAKVLFKLGKATTLPYVRTPVNLAIEAFEYAVPMYSLGRSMEAAYKGKRREALDYFGKAMVGAIISSIAINLIKAGIMTPASSDEDKLKQAEFTGKEGYRLNIDALHRWMAGESPEWQDGDETVTLKGYGTLSMIFMAYGAAYKDKTQEEIGTKTAPERWATVFGSVVTSSLEQSIMTGVNTALQAALKGEKERDRWLINTATALSSAVYPNTVSSISKTFADENYLRETRDMSLEEGKLRAQMVNNFKDRMFMGKDLPTKVSIWGEKVKLIPDGNTWTYNLLGVTKNKKYQKYSFGTKMYELYEEYKKTNPDEAKGIFPTLPSPSTKVGWDKSLMTPEQLQNYQIRVGELRAEYAENYVNSEEFKDATIDERVTKLTSMYSKARRIADSEMFRWSGFEKNNPEQWRVLSESDAVPLPSNVRKIKSGMREFTLNDEAIEQLNIIALDRYAERTVPWLEKNKDKLATLKEINERTKESPFLNKTNGEWDDAITYAKRIMASVLREKE